MNYKGHIVLWEHHLPSHRTKKTTVAGVYKSTVVDFSSGYYEFNGGLYIHMDNVNIIKDFGEKKVRSLV
jgi:hypothetical protein